MTESRASARGREASAKLTIRVYTVSREGVVSPPRALLSVPHSSQPQPALFNTRLPACECPLHRAGALR